jgi:hypothetical protein
VRPGSADRQEIVEGLSEEKKTLGLLLQLRQKEEERHIHIDVLICLLT